MLKCKYQLGDIIEMDNKTVGMICDITSAADFMAIEKGVSSALVESYSRIPIYKVLSCGRMTYVSETNIVRMIKCQIEKEELS